MLRRTCAVALAVLLTAVPAAYAHNASPDYLTQVNAVTPATKGVTVTVINRSDRLLLHNTSNANVLIDGYKGEPYARVLADGTVAGQHALAGLLPQRGPLRRREVPASADGQGAPQWKVAVEAPGRFEWHDHRMHWMSQEPPPQVKDKRSGRRSSTGRSRSRSAASRARSPAR